MPDAWLSILLSVLVISAASMVGALTLAWNPERIRRVSNLLVSLAVGALLGDVFLHLVPEAFEASHGAVGTSLGILAGILVFFVLERLLRRRLYHLHEHHGAHPVAVMNLVGDGLHNLMDGMIVAASWMEGPSLGLTTSIAVLLHEVPQEIGDFGVLVHTGLAPRRALLLNLGSALVAVLGAGLTVAIGANAPVLQAALVPFTAGGLLYIAASDLIPELQHEEVDLRGSLAQLALIAGGIALMWALKVLAE